MTARCLRNRNGEKAFTVLELLVCITVAAVLTAILFAGFQGVERTRRETQCVASLRSLHQAATFYAADRQGRFPDTHWWMSATGLSHSLIPYLHLTPYLGKPTLLTCLEDHRTLPAVGDFFTTYSLNRYTTGSHQNKPAEWAALVEKLGSPVSFQQCATPSSTALFMDGVRSQTGGTSPTADEERFTENASGAWVRFPHRGSFNAVFLDGHVAKLTREVALKTLTAREHPFWGLPRR